MADTFIDISDIILDTLSDESLYESKIKSELQKAITSGKIKTNLDAILFLLDALRSKITIQTRTNNYGTFYSFSKHRGLRTERGDLMTYGAKVVYSLREFFNQEQIQFDIGITTMKGEHKAATISQREVLKNLSQVGKKAIGLSTKMEKLLIESENSQSFGNSMMNQWSKIVQWADVSRDYDGSSEGSPDRDAYRSEDTDTNVYLRFSGGKRRHPSKYYRNEIYFNNGWLWQWFLQLAKGTEDGPKIIAEMEDLSYFFDSGNFKVDNILGTKEGDVRTLEGQQVQAKMNNNTIIRFNTILQIIDELHKALLDLQQDFTSQESIDNVSNKIKEFLMPTVPVLNKEAQEILSSLIQPLAKRA